VEDTGELVDDVVDVGGGLLDDLTGGLGLRAP
jgi:hypothetical protein